MVPATRFFWELFACFLTICFWGDFSLWTDFSFSASFFSRRSNPSCAKEQQNQLTKKNVLKVTYISKLCDFEMRTPSNELGDPKAKDVVMNLLSQIPKIQHWSIFTANLLAKCFAFNQKLSYNLILLKGPQLSDGLKRSNKSQISSVIPYSFKLSSQNSNSAKKNKPWNRWFDFEENLIFLIVADRNLMNSHFLDGGKGFRCADQLNFWFLSINIVQRK